jgi:hypothetical protein
VDVPSPSDRTMRVTELLVAFIAIVAALLMNAAR